ncbi:MAG: M15 family metallopeptidase [Candidatus Berkiellales bacterium]
MAQNHLPEGFVVLKKHIPELIINLKYCGSNNLIGRPLKGYASDGSALLTAIAAESLKKMIQALRMPSLARQLKMQSPTLLIWEAYRPQIASEDFWEWSQSDCEKTKADYYPNINKRDFFKLGYIVKKSGHNRGSTIDLTIIDTASGKMLEMGTRFDFMDPLSHPDNPDVSPEAFAHRQFLKQWMAEFNWQGIPQEWWHFTFKDEPFTDTYFDFPVLNYE